MSDIFKGIAYEFKGEITNPTITPKSRSITLKYPTDKCTISDCSPYKFTLQHGIYQFECWGAKGAKPKWGEGTPGLGAYTSGIINITEEQVFYVYIGATGFYNAIINRTSASTYNSPEGSGGSTDVRLNSTDDWYDDLSLVSRIMVAAGGGSAEWVSSIGGNGGTIEGGKAISGVEICLGATQTASQECSTKEYANADVIPAKGGFGFAGNPEPFKGYDDGGFGGNGYYGGTSYPCAYSGSGGSSFISGHEGCKAIKEPTDFDNIEIVPKEDSIHYSGISFLLTKMIAGNQTMPLPNGNRGIWSEDNGAFRITYLLFKPFTCKKRSYSISLPFILEILTSILWNI